MSADDRSASRSADLRSRKAARAKDKITQASEKARHPVNVRPVTVRGNMAGTPGKRRTQSNVRKKYYYTLNTTGAEVRLPAFPILHAGWRLLSGGLVIVLLVGIWAMYSSSTFQVGSLKIVGAKRIAPADINTSLDLEGASILDVIPDQVKEGLLAAYPDIEEASIQVGLPANVVIRIKERQPVVAWQQNGETRWIDQAGMIFPVRGDVPELVNVQAEGNPPAPRPAEEEKPAALPNPKPKAPQPFINQDLLVAIQKLSVQAPSGTPVLYDPRYGLGWNDPQGWKVYYGMDIENMDLKLEQYKVIVTDLGKRGIQPKMISVEFPHAPFYRLEP